MKTAPFRTLLLEPPPMFLKPRRGNLVSNYILSHDDLSNINRRLTHVKQHRVLRSIISEQVLIHTASRDPDYADNDEQNHGLPSTASEVPSEEDSSSDSSSISSIRSDEWCYNGQQVDDDIMQAELNQMRLEDPIQIPPIAQQLGDSSWAQPSFRPLRENKRWSERQNWKSTFVEIGEELVQFKYGHPQRCQGTNCTKEGLWRCLDCDRGKYTSTSIWSWDSDIRRFDRCVV